MKHTICDECETVVHCSNNGCIPKQSENVAGVNTLQKRVAKTAKNVHEQPAQQHSICNKTLREEGKAYPRTCKGCGLGPCIADRVQPAQQQEPVASVEHWCNYCQGHNPHLCQFNQTKHWPQTYVTNSTSPPASKPWVGLTDEEVKECFDFVPTQDCQNYEHWRLLCARNIEAKLKEKNA